MSSFLQPHLPFLKILKRSRSFSLLALSSPLFTLYPLLLPFHLLLPFSIFFSPPPSPPPQKKTVQMNGTSPGAFTRTPIPHCPILTCTKSLSRCRRIVSLSYRGGNSSKVKLTVHSGVCLASLSEKVKGLAVVVVLAERATGLCY